ncbi:MAG: xanthine dehydrogenase family protein subunit M [Betaproteobacteria bacterium]|nr:xanthine dehydrogenase family protein subunit M [Betaproteobacteria bacterium]
MYAFNYHRATSTADAAAKLGANSDAKLLAGGQTLLAAMKLRLANPSDLVDLAGIADLAGIRKEGNALVIGAMTRHAEVAESADVRASLPALARLAGGIGDRMVRNMGTLGGSIANNDPAADYPAAVVGLGATVHTNRRKIDGDAFFTGMYGTALDAGEIVTAVAFPLAKRAGYAKFPNPASRYALVGVFVSEGAGGVRVAVTGAGSCVFRVSAMEKALATQFTAASLSGITVASDELNSDMHASAEYRAHLIGVMAGRAVTDALTAR